MKFFLILIYLLLSLGGHTRAFAIQMEEKDGKKFWRISQNAEALKKIDTHIQTFHSFSDCQFWVKTTEFEKRDNQYLVKETGAFQSFSKTKVENGNIQVYLLIKTFSPPQQKGNILLKENKVYWHYNRQQNFMIRVTTQQSLQSTVTLINIATLNYQHYQYDDIVEVIQQGDETFYLLTMRNPSTTETLNVVQFYYHPKLQVTTKAEYYDRERRLSAVISCKSFQKTNLKIFPGDTGLRVQKIWISHTASPTSVYQLEYSDVESKNFPDYMFDKSYLK